MTGEIEITVGDVNDVEARVYASYVAPEIGEDQDNAEPIVLHGTLRGPECISARTLPAVVMFRQSASAQDGAVEAVVPDPCVWSTELPHVYQADIVARRGDQIVAEFHGPIGFRSTRG